MTGGDLFTALRGGALALCLLGAMPAHAMPSYSSLIAFGDSLSDTGNAANLTEAASLPLQPLYFDPAGYPDLVPDTAYAISRKLTNDGPTWVESLAAALGLPALPSTVGGTVYAIGGANSTDALPYVPAENPALLSVEEQVQQFLVANGNVAPSNALYTFTLGSNDLRDAVTYGADPTQVQEILNASMVSVVGMVGVLATAGAQDILFVNVPNLGLSPQITLLDGLSPGTAATFSQLAALYNANLSAGLMQLVGQLALGGIDLNLMLLDAYGLLTEVAGNPAAYGFSNATDSCLWFYPTPACANPDEYVFWDGIHPTTAMHQVVGAAALRLVPLPGTVLLVVAGLFALRARRGGRLGVRP